MHNVKKLLWLALCAVILAACSSSNDPAPDPVPENTAPVVDAIADQTVESEGTFDVAVVATDADADDVITLSVAGDGASIDGTTLTFVAPAVTEDTVVTVTVTANDGTIDSDPVSFDVTITAPVAVNTPPVVEAIDDQTVESEGTLVVTAVVTDPDVDDVQTLTVDPAEGVTISGLEITFVAPAVTEDTVVTLSVTSNDGTDDSAPVTFDVTVTAPVAVAPAGPIFDGSVDETTPAIEMVAVIPNDDGSFTAFYSDNSNSNGGVGGISPVFEQDFAANGAPVADSLISGTIDTGPNVDPGSPGFAPDQIVAAEAVVTPAGTILRPIQEQFGANSDANGTSAETEISLTTGSIDGAVARADFPVIFQSLTPFSVTAGPVEQTFTAIGNDSLLAFSLRGQQNFSPAVDQDMQDGVPNDGTGVADGVADEVDVTSAALGNVALSLDASPTNEVFGIVSSADGLTTVQTELFVGETLDFFDPTEPANGVSFASVFNATLQGAAFPDESYVAVLGDLSNTLRIQFVDAAGLAGAVTVLDDTLVNSEDNIAVATLSSGQVMIAWTTVNNPVNTGPMGTFNPIDPQNETSVVAVVLNADGTTAVPEFQIGGNNIFDPRIVALADGRAAVSWFGGDGGLTFAAQIIDPVDAANNSVIYPMPGARVDGTENGAAGTELADGNVVFSINDDDFVILVEGVGFLTNPQ